MWELTWLRIRRLIRDLRKKGCSCVRSSRRDNRYLIGAFSAVEIRRSVEERNNGENMQVTAKLFNRIARSHMYWGRKPLVGLLQLFDDVADGVLLDPFCGAGTPAIAALINGARVIVGDLSQPEVSAR